MSKKMKTILALFAMLFGFLFGVGHVRSIPFPARKPPVTLARSDKPAEKAEQTENGVHESEGPAENEEMDEADNRGDEDDVGLPVKRSEALKEDEEEEETPSKQAEGEKEPFAEEGTGLADGEVPGIPPVPLRGVPPSLRNPRIAKQQYGPPPPPDTWTEEKIAAAKSECDSLISETNFEFEPLAPIREGICGAPAPISLSELKLTPAVEITPAVKTSCPMAAALNRWMKEVVEPRAKELLKDDIVSVRNLASYVCRTRYNDPTQRISYHAYANAIDIAGFTTSKGEEITVLDNWKSNDDRAKFLKEIHEGACKIFGTVLGPEANAAHRNHFHLDMAKRRFSAYCE